MCGIAGILDKGVSNSLGSMTSQLREMLNAMRHRGPDDRGENIIRDANGHTLYLGHQRLSIIEPGPGGHQPMSNDDSTVWISTNSEIYNYHDLKNELKLKYNFRSKSDTEVLLRSYEAWGADCLAKLRGMFAFAIWDGPNSRLILARDRMGIKPLYYCSTKNTFIFSSELRAIQATTLVQTSLNTSGIFQYLSFGRIGSPETILNPIRELPPGHFLIANKDKIQIKKYWDPLNNANALNSDTPINEQIGEILEDAVRLRLLSDVPLGAFLSGGIDSSAVVGLMANNTSNSINTLSVTFKEKIYDESKFSKQIASKFNTNHHELHLSEDDIINSLPFALSAMDQPTTDGINTYFISRAARQIGLKVALSGLGGDELFAGYDSFFLIPRLNRIKLLMSPLPFFLRKQLGQIASKLTNPSDKNTKLIHLFNGQYSGAHVYFLFRALFCENQVANLFSEQSIWDAEKENNMKKTQELIASKSNLSAVDLISYLELTQYMTTTLLRDTDMMSMAHGLEVRVPLVDHKLVELMFSIPSKHKIRSNLPKPLLIQSLKTKLPDALVCRKKMGFTLPFETWMRGKMKAEIESVLLTPSQKLSNLISEAAVKKIWIDYKEKRCSWSRPWSLYVLKKWVEKNI